MAVVKKPQGVGDKFERRRANALSFPVDIGMAARPMFRREGGKPSFQEVAVERGVVGGDEHDAPEQIVDGAIVDAMSGHHLIGDPGQAGDLGRDRKAGAFEPLPWSENLVDPPVVPAIFEEADGEFDDPVTIGVGTGGLDIHHGGNEFWIVVWRVVFGLRL